MYIHTPTKEEYDRLMKFLTEKGYTKYSGGSLESLGGFESYGKETVINATQPDTVCYGSKEFYIRNYNATIISVDEAIRQLGGEPEKIRLSTPNIKYLTYDEMVEYVKINGITKAIVDWGKYEYSDSKDILPIYLGIYGDELSTFDNDVKDKNNQFGYDFDYKRLWEETEYTGLFGIESPESTPETPQTEYQNIEPQSIYNQVCDILKSGKYALVLSNGLTERKRGSFFIAGGINDKHVLTGPLVAMSAIMKELDNSYYANYKNYEVSETVINSGYEKVIPLEPRQYTSADADYIKSLIDGKEYSVPAQKSETIELPQPTPEQIKRVREALKNPFTEELKNKQLQIKMDIDDTDFNRFARHLFGFDFGNLKTLPPLNPLETLKPMTNTLQDQLKKAYFTDEVTEQTAEIIKQLDDAFNTIDLVLALATKYKNKVATLRKGIEQQYNDNHIQNHQELLELGKKVVKEVAKSDIVKLGSTLAKEIEPQTAQEYLDS